MTQEEMITQRFKGASWFTDMQRVYVAVAGLGGIGSWASYLMARCNPYGMKIFDNDYVAMHNMGGQMFDIENIGESKAYCMQNKIRKFYSGMLYAYDSNFRVEQPGYDVVLSCVDSMRSRKDIFEMYHKVSKTGMLIDGRLAAEQFQVLCVDFTDPYSVERYQKEFLFDDREAEQTICSYKQTSYMSAMIASYMVNMAVNHISNMNPNTRRPVPFYTEYDGISCVMRKED